ncbi:MAG: hypothetical protein QM817_21450 [Archangium sp.]
MTWDQAIEALFRAPHADFVAERKRIAGELKTAGDKAGAAKLGKLARPPASAWAVNQLWWRERAAFQELLELAKRVREGAMDALPAHKASVAGLVKHAGAYLAEIGNAAGEATLRRVETSLAAIAAGGGFDPEPAGALTEDREPSGFLSLGIATGGHVEPAPKPEPKPEKKSAPVEAAAAAPSTAEAKAEADAAEAEAAAEAARRAAQLEAERREAVRRAAEIEIARKEMLAAAAAVSRLEGELTDARRVLDATKARLDSLQTSTTQEAS